MLYAPQTNLVAFVITRSDKIENFTYCNRVNRVTDDRKSSGDHADDIDHFKQINGTAVMAGDKFFGGKQLRLSFAVIRRSLYRTGNGETTLSSPSYDLTETLRLLFATHQSYRCEINDLKSTVDSVAYQN